MEAESCPHQSTELIYTPSARGRYLIDDLVFFGCCRRLGRVAVLEPLPAMLGSVVLPITEAQLPRVNSFSPHANMRMLCLVVVCTGHLRHALRPMAGLSVIMTAVSGRGGLGPFCLLVGNLVPFVC